MNQPIPAESVFTPENIAQLEKAVAKYKKIKENKK